MMAAPLTVKARLASGLVTAHPWGIALDGLLASLLWARQVNDTDPTHLAWPSQSREVPDLDLPLARCSCPGTGQWHWAAGCSWAADPVLDVRQWTSQPDWRGLDRLTGGLPASLSDRRGRWRARVMPLYCQVADTVIWRAVGDPDRIRDLLGAVHSIGKKRSQGEGRVLSWTVEPAPQLSFYEAAHLQPDGTLSRPTPDACLPPDLAAEHALARAGLRPPYMHPSRQAMVRLPHPVVAR